MPATEGDVPSAIVTRANVMLPSAAGLPERGRGQPPNGQETSL